MTKIKEIEKRANDLLELYGIDSAPVPLEKIAKELSIQIQYEPFDGELSGILLRDEDSVIIGVNSRHAPVRQRFTIAHEIGHFSLHEGNKLHVDRSFRVNFRNANSSSGTNLEEIEANRFAAALLMPEKLVRESFQRKTTDGFDLLSDQDEVLEIIEDMAEEFKVSQQALLIRLGELGLQ